MILIAREGREIMIKVGENQMHLTDFVKIRYKKEYCDILFSDDPQGDDEHYFRSFIRESLENVKTDRNGLTIEQGVDEFGITFEEIRNIKGTEAEE